LENKAPSTEERILVAARQVFQTKGYDGARMQEIADMAGVNKALVHYYFRNKDKIFEAVFEEAFSSLVSKLNEIFFSDLPLNDKIGNFVSYYVSFISQNSFIPLFILNGLYERPEQLKMLFEKHRLSPEKLLEQMRRQVKEELSLEIDPMHIYINILALSVFPVIAKPLIQTIFGFSQDQLNTFYSERSEQVPEFILNALKGYEINSGK
jgi:AcrR family transcriptional regulator